MRINVRLSALLMLLLLSGTQLAAATPPQTPEVDAHREVITPANGYRLSILSDSVGNLAYFNGITFSKDATTLVTSPNILNGRASQWIQLWDIATNSQRVFLQGDVKRIYSLALSADGNSLAAGAEDGLVYVWDTQTGAQTTTLHAGPGYVWSVALSPNGEKAVSSSASNSDDGKLKLWDVKTGMLLGLLEGPSKTMAGLMFSPDGGLLAGTDAVGKLWLWNVAADIHKGVAQSERIVFGGDPLFSPDGTLIAVAGNGTIRLWNLQTNSQQTVLQDFGVRSIAFSPDGSLIADASERSTITLWEVADGNPLAMIRCPIQISALTFSADGNLLIASGSKHVLRLGIPND